MSAAKKKAAPGGAGGLSGTASPKIKREPDDLAILRRKTRYPDYDGSNVLEVVERAAMRRADTPAGRAQRHLSDILGALANDPLIIDSPTHHDLVLLLADLLNESEPDDDLDELFFPLVAFLDEAKGKRGLTTRVRSPKDIRAANRALVEDAYLELSVGHRAGRDCTSRIMSKFARATPPIKMSRNTVAKNVKAIRAES